MTTYNAPLNLYVVRVDIPGNKNPRRTEGEWYLGRRDPLDHGQLYEAGPFLTKEEAQARLASHRDAYVRNFGVTPTYTFLRCYAGHVDPTEYGRTRSDG